MVSLLEATKKWMKIEGKINSFQVGDLLVYYAGATSLILLAILQQVDPIREVVSPIVTIPTSKVAEL